MNLCSDQLLVTLLDPTRIASVSYLAADPEFSPIAEKVSNLHLNHGQAEELLPLKPDLIISGQFSATIATNLLERMGFKVLRLGVANELEDIFEQIRLVGEHTATDAKAEQIIASMETSLAKQSATLKAALNGKVGVFYSSNGFSYGSNTLQHDFLESLGMLNAAVALNGPAQLSLELLLREKPDYIFINPPSSEDAMLAHPLLQHPALSQHKDKFRWLEIPDAYFQCASPLYIEAYARLAEQI